MACTSKPPLKVETVGSVAPAHMNRPEVAGPAQARECRVVSRRVGAMGNAEFVGAETVAANGPRER